MIDAADLAAVLAVWGQNDPCLEQDLDEDYTVGPSDLAELLAAWGHCGGCSP